MVTPFEVYYGRHPNRVKFKLSLTEKKMFEVPEEDEPGLAKMSPVKKSKLQEWEKERDSIREEALKASINAAHKMVKRELKRNPPSLYNVGETVLVRIAKTKKSVKGKRTTLKGSCEGLILKADHVLHKYYVEFKNPDTTKEEKAWVKVDDLTSLTKEEETKRQKIAQELRNKRKSAPDSEGKNQPKIKKLNDDVGILDEGIDSILSSEKLKGDTINLYFDFLRQRWSSKEESISLASSYFYTSLERPGDSSSYQNYIGKNPLQIYENLIVPIHLPTEEHWLLVVISIINVCIYIYDSACFPVDKYNTIFQTLKQKFIKKERKSLPQEESMLLHEDNWDEKIAGCPKQLNNVDCGVFTCSFAKQLISSNCNSSMKHTIDFRNEMVSDLLELASSNSSRNERPKDFKWLPEDAVQSTLGSEKSKLDAEVENAGLNYRDPPTPKDGNCMFHALSDQLVRLGMTPKTPQELRSGVIEYLCNHPLTPDGEHFKQFVSYRAWDSYLRRMSQDGVWGDWITLWGLVNMLNIDIALVSSLGESGLRIISPADVSNKDGQDLKRMALLGHEAEAHYHSLDCVDMPSSNKGEDVVEYLKKKYGEGKVTEEICPKCCKKFQCLSAGVYANESGLMQSYDEDCYMCDECTKDEQWYTY